MLLKRTTPDSKKKILAEVVNTNGNLDYIKDGVIYKNAPTKVIMVTAQSDLADITDKYEAGTIAYTAGFENIWQLSAAGNWIEV